MAILRGPGRLSLPPYAFYACRSHVAQVAARGGALAGGIRGRLPRARRRLVLAWAERYEGMRRWRPSRFLAEAAASGVLHERAPVQFVNGSYTYNDLANRVTDLFDPLGLQLNDPVAHGGVAKTVILDYSGGKFPQTAAWLAQYFGGAQIVEATPANHPPARGQQTYGVVVVLGHDFGVRWYGL